MIVIYCSTFGLRFFYKVSALRHMKTVAVMILCLLLDLRSALKGIPATASPFESLITPPLIREACGKAMPCVAMKYLFFAGCYTFVIAFCDGEVLDFQ